MLPAFERVDLAGANTVSVRVGRTQSVAVRADDNLLRSVTTRVQDGVLVVGTAGSFAAKAPMSVDIGVPALEAATLKGTGRIEVQRADRAPIVQLSGSGVVRVSGAVLRLDVTLEGRARRNCAGSPPATCAPPSPVRG